MRDLDSYLPEIDAEMRSQLRAADGRVAPFYAMMLYHLGLDGQGGPPGKRLRPLVCLLLHEALGGERSRALPVAVGLELLHNFTLVHDDIEDQDPTRRHRPTVWARFGVAQAINAGDGMYAISRLAVQRLRDAGVPADRVLAVVDLFDRACLEVCEGQYLDLAFEGRADLSVADHRAMVDRKTGALLRAAAEAPGHLAGAGADVIDGLRAFGRHYGVAFQAHDDVLGIWGRSSQTGKAEMHDIAKRKMTLPLVLALERATPRTRADVAERYSRPAPLADDDVHAVRVILDGIGARAEVEMIVRREREAALLALAPLGLRPAPATLLRDLVAETTGGD